MTAVQVYEMKIAEVERRIREEFRRGREKTPPQRPDVKSESALLRSLKRRLADAQESVCA